MEVSNLLISEINKGYLIMNEKIRAVYIDNSKTFTSFDEVYIVLEDDDFKIRIGRTSLTKDKIKGLKLRVEGMKRNVYLTIKTPRKVFEFRDIEYKYYKELQKFEKDYTTRSKRNQKSLDDVVFGSAIGAADAANKFGVTHHDKDELHRKVNVEDEIVEVKEEKFEIKVEIFLPRTKSN